MVIRENDEGHGNSQARERASEGEVIFDDNVNEVRLRSDSESPIVARDEAGIAEGNSGTAASPTTSPAIILREPIAEDGPAVSALIASSPPLDGNSAYCNLLQCSDFAGTCVVAEREGRLLGWISAYRPPSHPDRIFVWQVAVAAEARGEGLGGRMLDALIARSASRGARELTTTITEANSASWGLFSAFARRHGAVLTRSPRFERDAHFAGAHDTEWQASIAPLPFTPSN
jgi:L-2,4-diaminobutyric acid acetyltransferase